MARVLLVDDEQGLRDTLRVFLESVGHEVHTAADAAEAQACLESNPLDIVVSDIILPRMTGIDLLEIIKKRWPQIHVILATGEPTVATATTAVRSGAFDYLGKPITKDKIISAVAAAEAAGPAVPASVQAENLEPIEIKNDSRRYLDFLPDVLWVMDLEFNYLYISPSIRKLRGYGSDELIGTRLDASITGQTMHTIEEALKDELGQELRSGKRLNRTRCFDLELRRKDGSLVYVEVNTAFVRDDAGKPVAILGVTRDLTNKRQHLIEEKLQHNLEDTTRRMQSLARLAGGLAHDFNNFLTSITGNVTLAEMDAEGNSEVLESLNEIRNVSMKAVELTGKLLEFSGRQALKLRSVDLVRLIGDLAPRLEALLPESARLSVVLPTGPLTAEVDAARLETSLIELVKNAGDASTRAMDVQIALTSIHLDEDAIRRMHLSEPADYAVISVRDTGEGIERETLPFVFEPFFTTKPKGKGKGIGLARVYGNLTQMQGDVRLVSESGKGTSVELYVRRCKGDTCKDEQPGTGFMGSEALTGAETILCVDDDRVVRDMCVRTLKRHGYKVLQASDGLEAVDLARNYNEPIHLLLTDVVMPKMDGEEAANAIVGIRPDIDVLFISGFTEKVLALNGNSDVNFMPKPFDALALARRVRDLLDA